MKYCAACGTQVVDEARFCPRCGASCQEVEIPEYIPVVPEVQYVYDPVLAQAQECQDMEQRCLDLYYDLIKWERLAWKITNIVFLVLSIIFGAFAVLFFIIGISFAQVGDREAAVGVIAMGLVYAIYVILEMLPITIASGIMKGKREALMKTVHTDLRPVVDTYNSAGCMVIAILFAGYPAIFAGINMGRTKHMTEMVNNIIAKQQAAMEAEAQLTPTNN